MIDIAICPDFRIRISARWTNWEARVCAYAQPSVWVRNEPAVGL